MRARMNLIESDQQIRWGWAGEILISAEALRVRDPAGLADPHPMQPPTPAPDDEH